MMNDLQALPQWHDFMKTPTAAWLGFINEIQSLGQISTTQLLHGPTTGFRKKKSPIAAGYFWFFRVNLPIAAQSPLVPLAFVIGQLFIWGASAFFGIFAASLITAIAYPTHRDIFTALSNYGWYVSHFSLIASSRFSFRPHVKAARRSHCNLTFSQQTLALNISLFPSYLTNPHLEKFIIFLIAAWATNGPRDYTST